MTVVNTELLQLFTEAEKITRQLQLWCSNNGIHLNTAKSEMLQYYPVNEQIDRSILVRVDGKSMQQVDSVKILGLNIDYELTWKTHSSSLYET